MRIIALSAFCLLSCLAASQAPAQTTATASLDTYVRVVAGDSLNFFYETDYGMAQPACACIRRQTRLDGTGSFHGAFRDARWPTDSVQLTGRYQHGQKEGLFTHYHRNGKMEAQGQYLGNRRSGEWKFWYASGQPAEVLSYGTNAQPEVRAAWTADGQPVVVNGNGQWKRQLNGGATQFSGPVIDGRPTGTWQLVSPKFTSKVLLTETYGPSGAVVAGVEHIVASGRTEKYKGVSRVVASQEQTFEAAETFRLRQPCQFVAAAASVPAVTSSFKQAFYRGGASAYSELMWLRIRPIIENPDRNGVSPLTTYRGTLRFKVRLDAKGNWQNEPSQPEGTNLEAARQMLGIMRNLPRWQPAHQDGQPVESTATVEFTVGLDRYSLIIQPGYNASPPATVSVSRP
ncbi:toxin-antitoxin system YwqK family antitoxin [Hymenobacter sp. B1770]|uniref:toxin-antitoxin system YwqK family antitoxin n=1 Tax=Hymenobacter sp. B1770 TaxID=1718788 RepID=UPI003CE9C0CE